MSYYGKVLEELLVGKYQLLLLLFKNKYCFKSFKTQAVCNLHFVPGYPFNPTKIWGASYVQGAERVFEQGETLASVVKDLLCARPAQGHRSETLILATPTLGLERRREKNL